MRSVVFHLIIGTLQNKIISIQNFVTLPLCPKHKRQSSPIRFHSVADPVVDPPGSANRIFTNFFRQNPKLSRNIWSIGGCCCPRSTYSFSVKFSNRQIKFLSDLGPQRQEKKLKLIGYSLAIHRKATLKRMGRQIPFCSN